MEGHDLLFTPMKIRGVLFKNRIQAAPQVPMLATPEGWVTPELIDYYTTYTRGGFGIVTVGDSAVDALYAQGHDGALQLGSNECIPGLSRLAESVRRGGTQASIEINHAGRNANQRLIGGKEPIGPSPIPCAREERLAMLQGRPPVAVKQLDDEEIHRTIRRFADAARRCQEAGFEMIMVHGGHGHLLSQFLSPYSNRRTDRWGGTLEKRARFPIAVLNAIREACGPDLVIEYRISLEEKVPGGMEPAETIEFLKMIEEKIDIIHVSAGVLSDLTTVDYMMQPFYMPRMLNVPLAAQVKRYMSLPVTAVGSLMDLDNAESILANGWADFVAFARPALADPEMVRKVALGRKEDIRPCIRCNCCVSRSLRLVPTRCAVNAMAGCGPDFNQHVGLSTSRLKKKVMVVGGGPAGMEAAQRSAQRGHNVVLYEMNDRLGGMLSYVAALPSKGDLKVYLDWMVRQTEKSGTRILLNTEATADTVRKEKPDALIIAVGTSPAIPAVPGIRSKNVHWAGDVIVEKAEVGSRVIVVGAGLTGIEAAIYCADQGKTVAILDILHQDAILRDEIHRFYYLRRLEELHIRLVGGIRIEEVVEEGIRGIDRDSRHVDYEADSIVLASGLTARTEKVEELRRLIPETEVFVVGDCKTPRGLFEAVHEAFNAVCDL
jgi:2,4-dienoyl-CoA reductase-like NADH-dependent reductase (Old Yellow Enzyme family)/NADPH-dependent 2,4-dienoyl-CoA reductase/sulfur reductase-like enzyme